VAKRRGLGKGLDVLIGSAATMEGQRLEEIPVKDIRPNPRQPRKKFDQESIEQMARSIETFGVVQPVIVRTVGTDFELVAGERRWRAAREAGLEKIPAIVRQSTETDSLEMALIENLHRSDLNGIEEANAYQQLLDDFAITHEELSRRVGKSRTTITNTLRLLQLSPGIQKEVVEGRITTGHARTLLALQDQPGLQQELCQRIINEGLSVRQTEELAGLGGQRDEEDPVDEQTAEGKPRLAHEDKMQLPEEVVSIFSRLGEVLDARVKGSIGKRKGKLIIEFRGVDDLRRIFENITGPWEAGADVEPEDADALSSTGVSEAKEASKGEAITATTASTAGEGLTTGLADKTRASGAAPSTPGGPPTGADGEGDVGAGLSRERHEPSSHWRNADNSS
jgi:ParB family transcriptional regulator, chromosome partitioning protein